MDKYLVVTFESVNFAMQTESVFKSKDIKHQIIPTPREITLSCGLSIKTLSENRDEIMSLVNNGAIRIKKAYQFEGVGTDKRITEI
ncbi:MAG: DUF3343 domain-containing protein [Clostridium sp.]|uniref:DUF3343 domain-containing protein n=1 Tax=Clostridium sp. TaxID=1506 RepID=UPI002FC7DEB4